MLLMKAASARVYNQGITKFGVLYSNYELAFHIGETVGIKWDLDDISKLYVYDKDGNKICEAEAAELLEFNGRVSQIALEEHLRKQKRQEKEIRQFLSDATRPYEQRINNSGDTHKAVGKIDLTIKSQRKQNTIILPVDKEFRSMMKSKKSNADNAFFEEKASSALSRIQAMNE